MNDSFKFREQGHFDKPSLIIGWQDDVGKVSPKVIEYINQKTGGKSFCEIEPVEFFSLAGIEVKNDVARFPESKFYRGSRNDLVLFKGQEAQFERNKFLDTILEIAQIYCEVKELIIINATISAIAHTSERRILAVYNQEEIQKQFQGFGLEDMNWVGPPAISSYLLWTAQKRKIPGAGLWLEIPFYLAASEDEQAIRKCLALLNSKLQLELDFRELDEAIHRQNQKIDQLRQEDAEINKCIGLLESNLSLSEEEQIELTKKVIEVLEK